MFGMAVLPEPSSLPRMPPGSLAAGGAPSPMAVPSNWPPESLALAQQLQRSLSIDERQWHRLKGQRPRRAAEQLAAALVQLLAADDPKSHAATQGRREAIDLVEHALGWLRAEISDPGCPTHAR
jgi:hypothetical protein